MDDVQQDLIDALRANPADPRIVQEWSSAQIINAIRLLLSYGHENVGLTRKIVDETNIPGARRVVVRKIRSHPQYYLDEDIKWAEESK
jgi:hypothetical protein